MAELSQQEEQELIEPEQLDHQRVHEFGGPTRAYDAGDRPGEGKAWKRGDYDVVPIFRKRIEQTFKFKI